MYQFYRHSSVAPNSVKPLKPKEPNDEPSPYFGTKAATWTAASSRSGYEGIDDTPWYQPFIINGSLALFLIYFCVLREENDVDEKLSKSLFDHYPALEPLELVKIYEYNLSQGLPVDDVEKRLAELGELHRIQH